MRIRQKPCLIPSCRHAPRTDTDVVRWAAFFFYYIYLLLLCTFVIFHLLLFLFIIIYYTITMKLVPCQKLYTIIQVLSTTENKPKGEKKTRAAL